MSLLSFLEKIDLECKDFPKESILNYKALRLDGEGKRGLRGQLGLGDQQNCCDYLLPNGDKLTLVEISDFIKQLKALRDIHKEVPKDCKKFVQDAQKMMRWEVKVKILSTLLILFKLPTKFKIAHEIIHEKQLEIILVICSNNPDDVREFEYLTSEIKNTLNPLIKGVKIVNIPDFNELLCNKKKYLI